MTAFRGKTKVPVPRMLFRTPRPRQLSDDFPEFADLPSGFGAFGISLLALACSGFFTRVAEIQLGMVTLSLDDNRALLQLPRLAAKW